MAEKRLQDIERQIKLGQWDILDAEIPILSDMRYAHPEDSFKDAVESLTTRAFSDSLTDIFTDKQKTDK